MTESLYNTINAESFAGKSNETLIDMIHELRDAYNNETTKVAMLHDLRSQINDDYVKQQFKTDVVKTELKQVYTKLENKVEELDGLKRRVRRYLSELTELRVELNKIK